MAEFTQPLLALIFAILFAVSVNVLVKGRSGLVRRRFSKAELVGRSCTIRSFRVDRLRGEARLRGGAVIPVRSGENSLFMGDRALIFEYDADGGFFWVTPVAELSDQERRSCG